MIRKWQSYYYSYKSFIESDYWIELHKVKKELSQAAELEFYTDILKSVEFDYLAELINT
ncbi:hypothetical protein ACQP6C_03570 [Snodgrassella alvi]|uniref:hypothetical protein n=1 Tax=Snodgrassella alvi TaxID=1196083 RepID=UPI003D00EDF3